ncbi:hypothetical protein ACVXG9_28060 [Escherichia coli]
MTTTENKASFNELAVWSVIHTCSPIRKNGPLSQGLPFWSGRRAGCRFPCSLLELWRVLKACVTANKII